MRSMRIGQISIIDGLNFPSLDFLDVIPFQNPISSQGRQALNWVKRHAWIAPRAAGIVNADRLVLKHYRRGACATLDLAGHCFGWSERDLAERNPNIGM